MKNSLLYAIITGVTTSLWLFIAERLGFTDIKDNRWAIGDYILHILPAVILYFGLRSYRNHARDGRMGYLDGIVQGFKIFFVGGVISGIFAVFYLNWVSPGILNIGDFSGRIVNVLFGAIGFILVVPLLLMNSLKKIN